MAATMENALEIQLLNSSETMVLNLDEIPDSETLIELLSVERIALSIWITLAKHLYKQKRFEDFIALLDAATRVESGFGETAAEHHRSYLRACAMLAAHFQQTAAATRDAAKRKQLFDKATTLYAKASSKSTADADNLVGHGWLHILSNDKTDTAKMYFDMILGSNPDNIPALLGRGCLMFNEKNFKGSLENFQAVLRKNPQCPAYVRNAIGFCLHRLGNIPKAKLAFERALEVDPQSDQALVALAILTFNSDAPLAERIQKGTNLILKAYNINRNNPMVLNYLSDHFFFKKEYKKAEQLLLHALSQTDIKEIQAESNFRLGRVFHAQGEFQKAFQHYYGAATTARDFMLPFYGLGQMYIYKDNLTSAAECFETILQHEPESYEAMKVLGFIYAKTDARSSKHTKAVEYLQKVTAHSPEDADAWIELASLFERTATDKRTIELAINAYSKAIGIFERHLSANPQQQREPEILNNLGCLYVQSGRKAEAGDMFARALVACQQSQADDTSSYYKQIALTVRYNQARVMEMDGKLDEAASAYEQITTEHPGYLDALLRLGCMARDAGRFTDAAQWFTEALDVNQNDLNTWTLFGNMHLLKQEIHPAKKKFEQFSKLRDGAQDPYAMLAFGNMFMQEAKSAAADKAPAILSKALDCFAKVLRSHTHNTFAANGVGCVLAEKGQFAEAQEVFMKVLEAVPDMPDATLNLAHVCLEQDYNTRAIALYEKCESKNYFPTRIAELQIYLARAYYKSGRFQQAIQALEKAAEANPRDKLAVFNLALVKKRYAVYECEREDHTVAEVDAAIANLQAARDTFHELSQATERQKYDPSHAAKEMQRCDDILKQVDSIRERAKAAQEKRERFAAQQASERQALLDRIAAEKEAERLRQEELERQKQIEREAFLHLVEERKLTVVNDAPRIQKKSRSKKEKDVNIEDEDDLSIASDASDEGGEEPTPKPRRERKKEPSKPKKQKRRKPAEEDFIQDDDADEDEAALRRAAGLEAIRKQRQSNKKYLSAETVSDSEDEDGAQAATSRADKSDDEEEDHDDDDHAKADVHKVPHKKRLQREAESDEEEAAMDTTAEPAAEAAGESEAAQASRRKRAAILSDDEE